MELGLSDTTLPIKQLVGANLAWVRQEVGPEDDDLLKSMKVHGLKLPLLLTMDMVVADGARRLVRAERLGWKTVPVCITNDWEVVRAYYRKVDELAEDGEPTLPMTWEEKLRLINGPLDVLYNQRRLELGRATRAENARRKASQLPLLGKERHGFGKAVSELLNWKFSDLRTVREIRATIATIAGQDEALRGQVTSDKGPEAALAVPSRAPALLDELQRLESSGGDVEGGLYTLLRRVRLIASGQDVTNLKTGSAKRRIGSPTFTERKAAAAANADAATGRELDAQTIANITMVLTNLGLEAAGYSHVRPTVLTEDILDAAQKIRRAVTQINALVRVMRAYARLLEERPES